MPDELSQRPEDIRFFSGILNPSSPRSATPTGTWSNSPSSVPAGAAGMVDHCYRATERARRLSRATADERTAV
jgi:hypothetical protein